MLTIGEDNIMDSDQKRRLTRYFLNSDTFLWGLGTGKHQYGEELRNEGQKDIYQWLFDEGFRERSRNKKGILISERVYRKDFATVKWDMVKEYGIEKIIEFVYRETIKQFGDGSIAELKALWDDSIEGTWHGMTGIRWRMEEIKGDKIKPVFGGCTFFDIDGRYLKWRWSKFAAIFFEEILPFIEKKKEKDGLSPSYHKSSDYISDGPAGRMQSSYL
jgi:hypothetical protein